ncbi:hypothetical protein D3C76_1187160 [compost metagenome]
MSSRVLRRYSALRLGMPKIEKLLPNGLKARLRYTSELQLARTNACPSSSAIWLPERSSTSSCWVSASGSGKRRRRQLVTSRLRRLGKARRKSSGTVSRRKARRARIETWGKLMGSGMLGRCCIRPPTCPNR